MKSDFLGIAMPNKKMTIWEKPLRIAILELLANRGGRITEKELYEKLKKMYTSISKTEINAELMRLEMNRLIYVDSSTPANKVIEIIKEQRWFKAMGGTE